MFYSAAGIGICPNVLAVSIGANGTDTVFTMVNPKFGTFEAFSGEYVDVLPKVGSVSVVGTLVRLNEMILLKPVSLFDLITFYLESLSSLV